MDRRTFLQATTLAGWAGLAGLGAFVTPGLAVASAPTQRRLIVLLLRGGMDGLHALVPYADRAYRRLRPTIALGDPGTEGGVLSLDAGFGLHPALAPLKALYQGGELAFIPATATAYRQRSHFDGQNVLENGAATPFAARTGWLNRALGALGGEDRLGLALGPTVPLILQGETAVASWADSPLPEAGEAFLSRLADTYSDDPLFARVMQAAANPLVPSQATVAMGRGGGRRNRQFEQSAAVAADLLAEPSGPRVAVLESQGWDTHFGQPRRLQSQFAQLARALMALRSGLGSAWAETAVLVVSEFGRTAAENGSNGTDHGVGGLAMLLGGAVQGGRILGPWPGLGAGALHEGRDLQPTLSTESLCKGVLQEHLGLPRALLDADVFPDSHALAAMGGLLRHRSGSV